MPVSSTISMLGSSPAIPPENTLTLIFPLDSLFQSAAIRRSALSHGDPSGARLPSLMVCAVTEAERMKNKLRQYSNFLKCHVPLGNLKIPL